MLIFRLGAHEGICYKQNSKFSQQVLSLTSNKGVDVILDPVLAGPNFNEVSLWFKIIESQLLGTRC
jgi:NADPH:quinone reductase-like Zn-dependent oxidoreductase